MDLDSLKMGTNCTQVFVSWLSKNMYILSHEYASKENSAFGILQQISKLENKTDFLFD